MPGGYIAQPQDDLNLHILRMFEGTFLLEAAKFLSRSDFKTNVRRRN